jgi:hypothetical protein
MGLTWKTARVAAGFAACIIEVVVFWGFMALIFDGRV